MHHLLQHSSTTLLLHPLFHHSDDDDSEEYGSSDDDDLPGLASRMSSSGSSDEGEAPAPEPAKRYQSSEGFKKGFLQNNTNSPSQRQRLDETERLDKERIKKLEKLNAKKRAKARKKAEKAELERKQKEISDRLEKERLQQIQAEEKRLRDRNEKSLKIQTFAIKNYRKRRAQADYQKHRRAIIMIQSLARMTAVVRKHGADLQERLALAREYLAVWGKLEDYVQKKLPEYDEFNWEDIKMKRLDQMNVDKELIDEEGLDKMNKKMDSAIVFALKDEEEAKLLDDESYEFVAQPELHDDDDSSQEDAAPPGEETLSFPPAHKIDQIQLTKDVLKWLDRQDSKYRGFFIRRICQLADGERSRILKKHLTGTKTAIWETYLDQKSGQRILWTECETFLTATSDGKPQIERGILVWYVAKHDAVNRLMRQIDRAEDRSSEKLTSALTLFKEAKDDVLQLDDGNRILADPLGDTPLKLHLLYRQDIGKLSSKEWKPRLHLTAEEHKVVDKEGTVLVLGRSGTGKTICIANRMHRDRERNPEASQLFVARSRRICSYVRGLVEGSAPPSEHAQYHTFARFIEKCERVLHIQRRQGGGDWGDSRDPDQMTFSRFKLEIYKQSTFELDALIVWSQIRSFIKGSIEAVKASRPLKREEYLQLGKSRCRLSQKHRELAYSAFEVYQSFMDTEPTLWDESDRIMEILAAVRRSSPEDLSEIRFDRIYIDEVQDYAQAELALFFYLGSPGGLFLAGDTAQSVSWGVDFRFEEVRSIGYNLFEDRRYVPDKPVTVNVNFRSHSGILNVAAAILDRMFDAFPKSANTLTPDIGAFTGPRPSLLKELNQDKLRELVSLIDSVVLLTHDEHVEELKEIVGKNVLVLGIRYSKGLEFPHVIIVDFFSGLDRSHQKPWRCLLSIRSDRDTGIDDLKDTSPELETQLKLLYTAITRCSKRLFFAETERSMGGMPLVNGCC
jgi:AAA domain